MHEETPKVEQTAVYSKTDVDAIQQVLFHLTKNDAEENGEQSGARMHPCLMRLEMGKLPDSDPLCFTRCC